MTTPSIETIANHLRQVWNKATNETHVPEWDELCLEEKSAYVQVALAASTLMKERIEQADAKIKYLSNHNKALSDELHSLHITWADVISWVIRARAGLAGQSFPQIVLNALREHAAVVADKNARIEHLTKSLSDANTYIEKLERDVALLSSGDNENPQTTDTIFFQIDDTVIADAAITAYDAMKELFPKNSVVVLPSGMNLHAIAQING